uniref:Uncharacterized protein n=1 Tax=Timema monikensis TaxID=170555 RepID=A0A7R9E1J2_9NEOP|nr:unnamed protein product [Timema monikensis]
MKGLPALRLEIKTTGSITLKKSDSVHISGIRILSSPSTAVKRDRESGKLFRKTTLSTPDQDSILNLSVIGSLVYCESSALNHAATEAPRDTMRRSRLYLPWSLLAGALKRVNILQKTDSCYSSILRSHPLAIVSGGDLHDKTLLSGMNHC